jgi:hypothetical protein
MVLVTPAVLKICALVSMSRASHWQAYVLVTGELSGFVLLYFLVSLPRRHNYRSAGVVAPVVLVTSVGRQGFGTVVGPPGFEPGTYRL